MHDKQPYFAEGNEPFLIDGCHVRIGGASCMLCWQSSDEPHRAGWLEWGCLASESEVGFYFAVASTLLGMPAANQGPCPGVAPARISSTGESQGNEKRLVAVVVTGVRKALILKFPAASSFTPDSSKAVAEPAAPQNSVA